jgi:hypothetical protein
MEWSEVTAQARCSWQLVEEQADWCGLLLDLDGRRQRVLIHRGQAGTAMTISAQVCASRYIDPRHALEYNGLSELWCLGLFGDAFVLRRTMMLADLTESDVASAIDSIAAEATRLHRLKVAAQSHLQQELLVSLFSHWYE